MKIVLYILVGFFAIIGFIIVAWITVETVSMWYDRKKQRRKNLKWYMNRVTELEKQLNQPNHESNTNKR